VTYRLTWRRYRLPFLRAVRTAHGPWMLREGLLVRLEDDAGCPGFGEVAPIPWFGTETLAGAEAELAKLGGTVEAASLEGIDEGYGCLRFALGVASAEAGRATSDSLASPPGRLPVAALLPAGKAALAALDKARAEGYVAFKWKVGVLGAADEQVLLDDLLARLPQDAKLRLDANGAWTARQAARWLDRCAERPIEFVEQPCFADPSQGTPSQRRIEDVLLGLARDYPTKLALDESVAGMRSLRTWLGRGWPGVLVVKPALLGAPAGVLALLDRHQADVVFSSALETAVGQRAALRVAFQFKGAPERALGFGVAPLFEDARFDGQRVPFLSIEDVNQLDPTPVWNALN